MTHADPADRRLILAGANPGVRLLQDERVTAFASVWRVDWSVHGSGTALVLWHAGAVRVIGANEELAGWLERYFVRFFPEVDGLVWPRPQVERAEVRVRLDLAGSLTAHGADIEVTMSGALDRRVFATDEFPLDAVPHSLSLVLAPMRTAAITVAGVELPGVVVHGGTAARPSSSAFLADAEVWRC